MSSAPIIVGVRHHSPACARVVRWTIQSVRPRFVLVEGPAEMNERMDELALRHTLPVALYSYMSDEGGGRSRGAFSPFCDYSPEWVALEAAREVSARPLFMDLPSYDDAFHDVENRYSDRHLRASDRMAELAKRLGFEDTDSLWDHLFEGPSEASALAARLATYFVSLRGDEPGGPRDEPREAFMARFIAWAMKQGGPVVVVCGGYHAPALARLWPDADASLPTLPAPVAGTRVGTYLVPYSFHRLDAFAGYQSGMPSPAFYDAVWRGGPSAAATDMVRRVATRLREKKQRVSSADLISAATMTEGLTRLRGHEAPLRVDVLDGLAAALLKEATRAPLPWTRRGPLPAFTDPMIVEMVAAFSGDRYGRLADGTPRPPLVDDAFAALTEVGVVLKRTATPVTADLATEDGKARSAILHRFRVLNVPEFQLVRGPSLRRGATDLSERWQVAQRIETDAALIEAAAYGATLESATHARLLARAETAHGAAELTDILFDAARAGIARLGPLLLRQVHEVIRDEPDLERLGAALARLLGLTLHGALVAAPDQAEMEDVLRVGYERAAWLFEGLVGADVPANVGHVQAVVAMRDVIRQLGPALGVDPTVPIALARRRAADAGAPSYVRGAALGLLAALDAEADHEAEAVRAVRGAAHPNAMGDFLIGLFAVAREEVRGSEALVQAIDTTLLGMGPSDFLVAVPALRQAFAFFPPKEKRDVARMVVKIGGGSGDADELLELQASPATLTRGIELDAELGARAARYGLLGEEEVSA